MAPPLPQFVAISSSTSKNKYFRSSGPNGVLKSEEVDEVSVYKVKHEVVNSRSYPGMIHLKCVDTGKYWSWGLNRASNDYISAQQTKRVSDLSCKACTLVEYSHHTRNGASVFHLEFRRNSKWYAIKKDSGGFLKSGDSRDGHSHTNFVIEDWHQAARASRNKKNTGGGTSSGNGVAIGKLYVDKMICVVPSTSQPHQAARASKYKKNTGGGTSGGNIINGVAIGKLYVNKMIYVMPGTSQPFKNVLNGQVRHLLDGKDKAKK
jgi:hypothetical protein